MNALAARRRATAAGFTRRGACPALSAPMQTGDGLLARLNPVAGGLSPKALIGLCKAALRHGNSVVEVTARGSLQIRGLTPESAALLATEVDALGIAVRTGIPVQTGALAGVDPNEIADPAALAESIRNAIVAAGLDGRLGPKVSVVVDGGGRSGMEDVAADVRLTAVREGTNTLWQISIDGDAATAKPLALLNYPAAVDACIEVLQAIAAMGIAARARDLPAGREGRGHGYLATLPLVGDMSGTERANVKRNTANYLTCLGVFPLTETRYALGIALPFGHTNADKLIAFAEIAVALAIVDLRLAPKRTILALCPSQESAETLQKEAEKLGFVISSSDPRTHISACPGAPACASGHIAAREVAAEIANEYSDMLDGSFDLHISGCAKGCAHPGGAGLTIVGGENGAGLVVNGTARGAPLAYTARDGVSRAFGSVAGLLGSEIKINENSALRLSRLGAKEIAEAFGKE